MTLGGVICTSKGKIRLLEALFNARKPRALDGEMKWTKVSKCYFEVYCAWINAFFDDPHARYSALCVNQTGEEWQEMQRRSKEDENLSSVYYQFLLNTFGRLHDTQRWYVHPDAGYFSCDKVLERVEIRLNITYKKAFGRRSSRVIRLAQSQNSHKSELVQLADILLGCVACTQYRITPTSGPKRTLLETFQNRMKEKPTTQKGLNKVYISEWTLPDIFQYPRRNSGR